MAKAEEKKLQYNLAINLAIAHVHLFLPSAIVQPSSRIILPSLSAQSCFGFLCVYCFCFHHFVKSYLW